MITLQLDEFVLEIEDGTFKHVGTSNKSATVKLYDVTGAEAREFGDERVKLSFSDDEGNEVEVALGPEEASTVAREIENLKEGPVFE